VCVCVQVKIDESLRRRAREMCRSISTMKRGIGGHTASRNLGSVAARGEYKQCNMIVLNQQFCTQYQGTVETNTRNRTVGLIIAYNTNANRGGVGAGRPQPTLFGYWHNIGEDDLHEKVYDFSPHERWSQLIGGGAGYTVRYVIHERMKHTKHNH